MKTTFCHFICVGFCRKDFRGGFATDFSAANKLYAKENFRTPPSVTKKFSILARPRQISFSIMATRNSSREILGKAIAAFRRAELLSPRDSEIRANLAFVRNQVQGATVRESLWQNWLGNLSLNEWTVFAAIAFWLTFLLLAAKQIRPALAAKLKGANWIFAALTIFSGTILGVQAANHFSRQTAVVISAQATRAAGRLTMRKMRLRFTTARSFPFWIGATIGCKSPTVREKSAGCRRSWLKFCPALENFLERNNKI